MSRKNTNGEDCLSGEEAKELSNKLEKIMPDIFIVGGRCIDIPVRYFEAE